MEVFSVQTVPQRGERLETGGIETQKNKNNDTNKRRDRDSMVGKLLRWKMLFWQNLNVLWKHADLLVFSDRNPAGLLPAHPPPQQLAWQPWETQLASGLPAFPGFPLQMREACSSPGCWCCQAPSCMAESLGAGYQGNLGYLTSLCCNTTLIELHFVWAFLYVWGFFFFPVCSSPP